MNKSWKCSLVILFLTLTPLSPGNSNRAYAEDNSCRQEVLNSLSTTEPDRPWLGAYRDCDLSGIDFSGRIIYLSSVFVNFSGANFSNTKLRLYSYSSNLTNANFASADLNLGLSGSILDSANVTNAKVTFLRCEDSDLSNFDLAVANTVYPSVYEGIWSNCKPPPKYVEYTRKNVGLTGILGPKVRLDFDLSNVELKVEGVQVVDLSGVNLSGRVLPAAYFYKVDEANLQGANILSEAASGCKIQGIPSHIPKYSKLAGGCLFGSRGADFSVYDLSYMDLSGVNLQQYNLNGANLEGTQLEKATLMYVRASSISGIPKSLPTGYQIKFGYLLGPMSDLTGSDLRSKDLTSTSLAGSLLDRANLDNSNISNADLSNCTLVEASMKKTNLTKSNLQEADLSKADLSNANLSFAIFESTKLANANLTSAQLKGANLNSSDLGTANLDYVTSGGITGKPKLLPRNWKLVSGYLIGPTAKLAGSKLSKLNLSGVNLSKADLRGADLSGANLSGSNLLGVSLSGAKITGTTLLNSKLDASSNGTRVIGTPKSLPKGWKIVSGVLKKG